ncbi:MAG: hypothetical protein RIB86_27520 [Imperialibacter sp.]
MKLFESLFKNSFVRQLSKSIGFGLIAGVFALIQFNIPGFEHGVTNLGEIPILISVIYLSNPFYVFLSIFVAFFTAQPAGAYLDWGILSHCISILPFYYGYHFFLKKRSFKASFTTIASFLGVFAYYVVLTSLIGVEAILVDGTTSSFIAIYLDLWAVFIFEIMATSLSFTFFLLQFERNNELRTHINEIEEKIETRTLQLSETVNRLNHANEKLRALNERLDELVLARTKELENRNVQLSGYAFVNSHLLRAPVAKIIGLTEAIKREFIEYQDNEMINYLLNSCSELDEIVKLLTKYLTEDDLSDLTQLDKLKEQMSQISEEMSRKSAK